MATQKLSSHEVRVPLKLSENLLMEQGVSAPKSTGTTSRSRSTKPRLGHFLEQKLIRSGRKHPCACGRVKDGDCAFNDTTLFCHNSPLSDQFRWHGQTWFLHRTNCGHTGACNLYKPWPPTDQRRSQRSKPNGTSVLGGDGYCLSSLLNGVRQWHVLNLNCAVLMSCATTSKPFTRLNTRAMSCCRCWLMRPGTTPNTGGMSSLCSTNSRPCGTNAVTLIASAKTTSAVLNSTGGCHERIRLPATKRPNP